MPNTRSGFRIKSWGDVFALLAIIAMLSSALLWASMLQAGKEDHERRITRLESQIK